jgi:hypothetical protein
MEFSVSHGRDTRGEYSAALTDLLAVGFGPRGPRGPTIGNHRRSHASTVTRTILGLSSSPSSCCGSSSRRATGASPRFCAGCPSFGMHPGRQRCPTIPGFARRRNPAVRYGPGNGAATRPGTPPPRGRKTRPVWSRGTLPPVRCPRRVRAVLSAPLAETTTVCDTASHLFVAVEVAVGQSQDSPQFGEAMTDSSRHVRGTSVGRSRACSHR